jgi:glycosyltransferase involved in cell wall biosynthesis
LKITYYTHESITSGLFRTQVIDALKAAASQDQTKKYTIFVYNYFWLLIRNLRLISTLRSDLSKAGIRIRFFPILIPVKYALSSIVYFQLLKFYLQLVTYITYSRKADVHHCRGYLLTYALTKNGLLSVIFDMRSLWVLENISAGNLDQMSSVCRLWFKLEKQCLLRSFASVGVSPAMGQYASDISENINFHLIPISVAIEKFQFDMNHRVRLRSQLGWDNSLVVIYSGSLGLSRINIEPLKNLLKILKYKIPQLKCVVVSNERKDIFLKLFHDICFEENDYFLTSDKDFNLSEILSIADFGVHALPKQLDGETRLGTKVVEYMANGLPIIVNQNVGDAARLVREYKFGYVLEDIANIDFAEFLTADRKHRLKEGQTSQIVANNTFSSNVTSKKYNNLYESVVKSLCDRHAL